ncbi:hypothetical protein J6590_012291 [Homalodisca vitripennis]|nr:hypothetical protein J6590_012291 [Homalodisca vitripennis]
MFHKANCRVPKGWKPVATSALVSNVWRVCSVRHHGLCYPSDKQKTMGAIAIRAAMSRRCGGNNRFLALKWRKIRPRGRESGEMAPGATDLPAATSRLLGISTAPIQLMDKS